jgi:gamma-glutamylcyclotransferase (GGCT)/AIG2-like uncharacterized protein YtfP
MRRRLPVPGASPDRRSRPTTAAFLVGLPLLLLAAALTTLYLALIQPGSFRAVDPAEILALEAEAPHRVFAYGTLRSPLVRFVVTGRAGEGAPARLSGHRREGRDVVADPEGVVEGYLLDVTTAELRRLDRYERLGTRYERVLMTLDSGEPAWVYRLLPLPLP